MNREEQVKKLQTIEQTLQNIFFQKQQFQKDITETQTSLKDMEGSDFAYKIIGSLMVKKKTSDLRADLNEKIDLLKVRLEGLEKKEQELKKEKSDLQSSLNK